MSFKTQAFFAVLVLLCNYVQGDSPVYYSYKSQNPTADRVIVYNVWVDSEHVHTFVSSNDSPGRPIETLKEFFQGHTNYSLVIHGFCPDGYITWFNHLPKQISEKEGVVVTVDWTAMGAGRKLLDYPITAGEITSNPGSVAHKIVKDLVSPELNIISCFGHSLGAHQCGCVGRLTHLDKIWGMDPAGPWFSETNPNRLGKDSADMVINIGTSPKAHPASITLGTNQALGHVNFWFNWEGDRVGDSDCDGMECSHQVGVRAVIGMYKSEKVFFGITTTRLRKACSTACLTRNYTKSETETTTFLVKTHGRGSQSFNVFRVNTLGLGGKFLYLHQNTRKIPSNDLFPSYCEDSTGYTALVRGRPRRFVMHFENEVVPEPFVLQHKLKANGEKETQYVFDNSRTPNNYWEAHSTKPVD